MMGIEQPQPQPIELPVPDGCEGDLHTIAMIMRPYVRVNLASPSFRVENLLEDAERADRLRFMAGTAVTHL